MYPDPQNFFASPANASTLNAGQFGSTFAQYPCRRCASKEQAYDAQSSDRPQRNLIQLIASRFKRIAR